MARVQEQAAGAPARVRLGHEAVVAAAEALVDRDGVDALTMTSLAGELGVKVPSLYNHIGSLEALRGEVQVRTMRLLGAEMRGAAMGHAGIEGLRHLAASFRAFARRYPRRYELLTRYPANRTELGIASAEATEALLAMLRSMGFPETTIFDAQIAMFSTIHGFVALENSGFFGDVVAHDDVFELVVAGALAAVTAAGARA